MDKDSSCNLSLSTRLYASIGLTGQLAWQLGKTKLRTTTCNAWFYYAMQGPS